MRTLTTEEQLNIYETVQQLHQEDPNERAARLEREAEAKREQDARMRAIAAVYETADRIITGDTLNVYLKQIDGAPSAWSDGKSITLNTAVLTNYEDSDIIPLHGVNYHEVCHILYSPRAGSEIMKWAVQGDYMYAFNVLEDQRIETLFTARFPSTRAFLEASTMKYVLGLAEYDGRYQGINKQQLVNAFILTHGRRFLDKGLRKTLRSLFEATDFRKVSDQIAAIVDQYRTLSFPKDYDVAKELIAALKQILNENHLNQPHGPCGDRDPLSKGRPESGSAQSKDSEKADAQAEANNRPHGEGTDIPGDGDPRSGGDSEGEAGDKEQWEKNNDFDGLKKRLADQINDLMDKVANDKSVQSETKEFRRAVRSNERSMNSLRKHTYNDMSVDPSIVAASRSFGEALRELEQEADPAWIYEKPHGKLNMQRAMHADVRDFNKLFDQWYEGDDVCDIEAAVLLDCSGSMQFRMADANASAWSIKRGLERIGSRVTVYSFSDRSRLLYSADEKAAPSTVRTIAAQGGTDPRRALEETEYIMSVSTRATKIAFIVTDGWWDNAKQNNAAIKRMNADGVLTVVVHIGDLRGWEDLARQGDQRAIEAIKEFQHEASIMRSIDHPRALAGLAKQIITTHIKERLYR